jgi:hypothetical protein
VHQPISGQKFAIDPQGLRSMLGQARYIRCACDLDLLSFFHRHPCALLAGEQIFARLGYDCRQAAVSLEGLVDAGILKRSRGRSGAACLYALELHGPRDAALPSLLRIAATPEGRQCLMRLLKSVSAGTRATGVPRRMAPDRSVAA